MIHIENNQSMKTDLKLTQVLELVDKNIKAVIITVFYTLKKLIVDMKDFFFQKNSNLQG